jgi:hypothetical protein
MSPLPYDYEVTYKVTIAGDGLHMHGQGATATERRLREALLADPNVVRVEADGPHHIWDGRKAEIT